MAHRARGLGTGFKQSSRCTHVKGQDKSVASGFISCRLVLLLHRPHRKLLLARVQRMLQQRTLQGAATH